MTFIEPGRRMAGIRAGAVVFLGIAVANTANSAFHLVAARWLGPTHYGDLATLLTLLGLITLPLAGVQYSIAQSVAHAAALRDHSAVSGVYRTALRWGFIGAVGATALGLAVSVPVQGALGVRSLLAVALTFVTIAPSALAPMTWGLAQGLERFYVFSLSQASGPVLKLALLIPFLVAGWSVAGAIGATLFATLISVGGTIWLLRGWLHRRDERGEGAQHGGAIVVPATLGILAFTSLTSTDIVVAKLTLGDHETGLYGAASLAARIILYLPAAIVSVLLPKVSSRSAVGRETKSLLRLSVIATGGLCCVVAGGYALAPTVVLRIAFGRAYVPASNILWMFALEMALLAVVNVIFVYDLARRQTRTVKLLAGAAALQIAAYGVFHASAAQLLSVNIVTAALLVVLSADLPSLARTSPHSEGSNGSPPLVSPRRSKTDRSR